ncbi:MAG: ACP S-malonyltransferase, partial [Pseudomonadota bacterium]
MAFACVFPGQGSQSVGMLSELLAQEEVVKSTFEEASGVLGFDIQTLVTEGPEAELNSTDNTQPALLTAGVAIWRLLCEKTQHRPSVLAGHSLGEYTALVCGGVLEFAQAVALVRLRGQAMQSAVAPGEGAMAAILGLEDSIVRDACEQAQDVGVVAAVNYNAPGQIVIAGKKAAVEKASENAKAAGAKKVIPLAVSVPS